MLGIHGYNELMGPYRILLLNFSICSLHSHFLCSSLLTFSKVCRVQQCAAE
jgi:hypothetical protein